MVRQRGKKIVKEKVKKGLHFAKNSDIISTLKNTHGMSLSNECLKVGV